MKLIRMTDILLSICGLVFGSPIIVAISLLCWFDTRSPFFWQERVGQRKRTFTLVKFRTMTVDTPDIASHLASKDSITKLGLFLRRTKLDELPQLWNVLKGEMSLVGPRPCLLSQVELIEHRELLGVFNLRPGITGLAQIQGVDMSDPIRLARIDAQMIEDFSLKAYFRILFWTALGKGRGDRVNLS